MQRTSHPCLPELCREAKSRNSVLRGWLCSISQPVRGRTTPFWFSTIFSEPPAISGRLSQKEQERFHNLLKLAANSPFEGERQAALAAAERLVAKHGMTLDEAAQRAEDNDLTEVSPAEKARARAEQEAARRFREQEAWRAADKSRWEQAYQEARARGLDDEPKPKGGAPNPHFSRPRSNRRRNPAAFAETLLKETRLPLHEIAAITQLDIYQIVGIKLKLRQAKAA